MNDLNKEFDDLLYKRKKCQIESNAVEEVEVLKKICELAEKIYGEKSAKNIYYLNELGGASKYIGEYDLGLKTLEKVQNLVLELEGNMSVAYATTILNTIEVLRFKGELENLESMYLKVIDIYKLNGKTFSYEFCGVCNNLGLYYQNVGNMDKAIYYHKQSTNILPNMPEHIVEYATTLNNLVIPYKEKGEMDKAYECLEKAQSIYEKTLGINHAMYSSTLNNLSLLKLEEGDLESSANVLEKALVIVEKSFGKNSVNYLNLVENIRYIKSLKKDEKITLDIGEDARLIDKSKEFTNKLLLPKIKKDLPEVLDKINIALIGEGSEVLGYDDKYSQDHDYTFMPVIFLNEDDFEKYAIKLKNILHCLPSEFLGIKHVYSDVVSERRGVQNLKEYMYKYLGKDEYEFTIEDYKKIPEYVFKILTSGDIFYKGNDDLVNILEKIKYYPEIIRQNKIATVCTKIAQSGQYNYLRLMKRGDLIGANKAFSEFIENSIHLVYLLNKEYMPFYKWYSKGLKELDILGDLVYNRINELLLENYDMYKMSNKIEEICYFLVEELKKQKLSNIKGYFLVNHAIFIQSNIDDEFLKTWSPYED